MENDIEPLHLMTLKEAAELLQVSTRTLQRLIRANELHAIKIGHQWRIRATELTRWIHALDEL